MVLVLKQDGTQVEFNEQKIRDTLVRLKTPDQDIEDILSILSKKVKDGMSTGQIYSIVFSELKKRKPSIASRYSLKRAICDLGPAGYNFEDFMARILTEKGYQTRTRVVLNGQVITHEMDVLAIKGNQVLAVECKFHANAWMRCSIQTALYVYARFLDIKDGFTHGKEKNKVTDIMIATNAKFTKDVIAYAQSKNIKLLSWDYPKNNGIKDLVDKKGMYPLTVLNTLSTHEKAQLMKQGIILVREITSNMVKEKTIQEIRELIR